MNPNTGRLAVAESAHSLCGAKRLGKARSDEAAESDQRPRAVPAATLLAIASAFPFAFLYEGAFSGGKCLALKAAGNTGPAWQPPFGHAIPNWDFEIAEKPAPGQYRYLQFAWKALSKETKGMSLLLGRAWPGGGYNLFAGEHDWKEGVVASKKIADAPPSDWQIVTVDLWEMHKKPLRIQALSLAALGGGAAFDRIRLARSLEDLRGK